MTTRSIPQRLTLAHTPGRIPTETALAALAQTAAPMPTGTRTARMMEEVTPRHSIESITRDLGMEPSTELVWRGYLRQMLTAVPDEVNMRQSLHAKLREQRVDPYLSKALLLRALSYFRHRTMRKSAFVLEKKFDASQSRDEGGRFTAGAGMAHQHDIHYLGGGDDAIPMANAGDVKPVREKKRKYHHETEDIPLADPHDVHIITKANLHAGEPNIDPQPAKIPASPTGAPRAIGGQRSKGPPPAKVAQAVKSLSKGTSGEGSRGGHIIGHTTSGKPIYGEGHPAMVSVGDDLSRHRHHSPQDLGGPQGPEHDAHATAGAAMAQRARAIAEKHHPGWTATDHREAHAALQAHMAKVWSSAPKGSMPDIHNPSLAAEAHLSVAEAMGRASKSMTVADLRKGAEGEGSRGGHVIGHTTSGKPIYATAHASYAGAPVGIEGSSAFGAALADRLPNYTADDHKDAAKAHEGGIATAHAHAARIAAGRAPLGKTTSGKIVRGPEHAAYSNPRAHNAYADYGSENAKDAKNAGRALASFRGWSRQDHTEAEHMHDRRGNTQQAAMHGIMSGWAKKSATDGDPDTSAEGEKAKLIGKELNSRMDEIERDAGYKSFVIKSTKSVRKALALTIDLRKAEGARGGHIVGHTRSGKPIYRDEAAAFSKKYKNFTKDDHIDAAKAHVNRAGVLEAEASTTSPRLRAQQAHHDSAAIGHLRSAGVPEHKIETHKVWRAEKSMEKAEGARDGHHRMIKSSEGEGTRGGHIVGHTQSGKPIYGAGTAKHAGMTPVADMDGVRHPTGPHGFKGNKANAEKVLATHKNYTHADHQDAADAHSALASKHAGSDKGIEHARIAGAHGQATRVKQHRRWTKKQGVQKSESFQKSTEGEGTRGGHIIGHTKSGKPIYGTGHAVHTMTEKRAKHNGVVSPSTASDGHKMLRDRHPEYTKQDHLDAAATHSKMADESRDNHRALVAEHEKKHGLDPFRGGQISGGVDPAFGEAVNNTIRRHAWESGRHGKAAHLHQQAAKLRNLATEKSMKSEASLILGDYLEKGKSGGLPTVEQASLENMDDESNGGPFNAGNKGDGVVGGKGNFPTDAPAPGAPGKKGKGGGRVASSEGPPVGAPAVPVSDITYAKSMAPGSYTAQELAHSTAHAQALLKSRSERRDADVVVGHGVPTPRREAPLAKSHDERAAELARGGHFYVGDRSPALGLQPNGMTGQALCKSCGTGHSALFSSCPGCGEGAVLQKSYRTDNVGPRFVGAASHGLQPALKSDVFAPTLSLSDEE